MLAQACIGLGANLNDPVQQILDARRYLSDDSGVIRLLQSSSLYLSSPVGYSEQSDFVNGVCLIETSLSAHSLLTLLQSIEVRLGRQRDPSNQNAPRLIDLDLLLYANETINTETLIVPHPRMTERLFVLEPLSEIVPEIAVGDLGSVSIIIQKGHDNGLFDGQTLYRLS